MNNLRTIQLDNYAEEYKVIVNCKENISINKTAVVKFMNNLRKIQLDNYAEEYKVLVNCKENI